MTKWTGTEKVEGCDCGDDPQKPNALTLDEMMNIDSTPEAIDAFASSCETLNDYACDLRQRLESVAVRTGADIRRYNNGWRLEKYVEAELEPKKGHIAAWWIDLGFTGDKWAVSSNVSVSHTDIHIELPVKYATDSAALRELLVDTIGQLAGMTEKENAFATEIRRFLS